MVGNGLIDTMSATHIIEDDILYITIKPDAVIELEDMEENIRLRREIQHEKPILVLLDIRNLAEISKEARKYGAEDKVTKLNIAMAVITGNLTTKLIANFFIKFNKPKTPTRMFSSYENAVTWLNGFK